MLTLVEDARVGVWNECNRLSFVPSKSTVKEEGEDDVEER